MLKHLLGKQACRSSLFSNSTQLRCDIHCFHKARYTQIKQWKKSCFFQKTKFTTTTPHCSGVWMSTCTKDKTDENAGEKTSYNVTSKLSKKSLVDTLDEKEDTYYSFGHLRIRKVNVNIPNFLTVIRIMLALPSGYLFYIGEHQLAFYGYFIAGSCDWLDGYLARKWNQATVSKYW